MSTQSIQQSADFAVEAATIALDFLKSVKDSPECLEEGGEGIRVAYLSWAGEMTGIKTNRISYLLEVYERAFSMVRTILG